MKTRKILNLLMLSLFTTFFLTTTSCKKQMDFDWTDGLTGSQLEELLLKDPDAVRALINGAYVTLGNSFHLAGGNFHDAGHIMSLQLAGDLMTEDMVQVDFDWFYFDYEIDNNRVNYRRPAHTWRMMYAVINDIHQAMDLLPSLNSPVMREVMGQALALRAFCYHILIQRYQQTYMGNQEAPGVPIILSVWDLEWYGTDGVENLTRNTVERVYEIILRDLELALEYLPERKETNRSRVDRAVAQGFLARVYMCMHNWTGAEQMAREARQSFEIMSASDAGGGYGYNSENNSEWMWGIKTTAENSMVYVSFQSHICSDGDGYAGLGSYKAMDMKLYSEIPESDIRKRLHFVDIPNGRFYNEKFRSVPQWLMDNVYMRSSEMLLIEAEAQAQQGRTAQAFTTMRELMDKRDHEWSA
ncbi:MAG: RagB/SusD family nutrient uptake outer membrane protein, partial [Bacteroidales bacterium]|nr:RagB/SusD family nutrient uptake outer membrane protein [Bacteroidales bacterium]